MSYVLRPRHRSAGMLSVSESFLYWLIDRGVFLPIMHGPGVEPGSYLWANTERATRGLFGKRQVTASEAQQIGKLASYLLRVEQARKTEWEKYSPFEQARMENFNLDNYRMYTIPANSRWMDWLAQLADWAPRSGGFKAW